MALHNWWLFVVAVFLLSATPGPNMLHVLSRSVELGYRRSVAAMAGCLAALLCLLAASVAGLSTLLHAMPGLFTILRYAGAAYLLYLGYRAWRAPVEVAAAVEGTHVLSAPHVPARTVFRTGFTISISNPKAILFAAAFLPQFIDAGRPQLPQFAILVATFAVIEGLWYNIYALGGRSIAASLTRAPVKRLFNRLTGSIFAGFGLALLANR